MSKKERAYQIDFLSNSIDWENIEKAAIKDYGTAKLEKLTDEQIESLAAEFDYYSPIWSE